MKKIVLIMSVVLVIISFAGCKKSTEEEPVVDEITASVLSRELNGYEKLLGITEDDRREFVEEYGYFAYDVGLIASSVTYMSISNEESGILEEDLDMYKGDTTIETFKIQSSMDDHHDIPVDFVYKDSKDRDIVILVHGANQNRRKLMYRTRQFIDQGYNVLQYDQRASGENKAFLATYGIWEKYDLYDCVKHAKTLTKGKVSIFGSSLGGATVFNFLKDEEMAKEVSYAIVDCPFVSIKNLVSRGMGSAGYLEQVDEGWQGFRDFSKKFIGIDPEEIEVANYADKIHTPILMFASEKDNVLSILATREAFDKVPDETKYVFISKTAAHCNVAADDEEEYFRLCKELLSGELIK